MIDNIIPSEKWEFDEQVTKCFQNMLSRSIPQYEIMRSLTFSIGRHYVRENTEVIDLGCSNGIAIEPFVYRFKNNVHFTLIDISEPMLVECRQKYRKEIENQKMDITYLDLRENFPETKASLILSILTVQFIPIEYRTKIIKNIYENLASGGAFPFIEKVLGETDELNDLFVDEYYNLKRENQYTEEQIKGKRKSLEGVLTPVTAKWNEELLKNAGFQKVECFWRHLNFAGWIAVKN